MIEYAKVTRVDGAKYYVTFSSELQESGMVYKRLANYTPKVGDNVAFIVDEKGKKICIGGVI